MLGSETENKCNGKKWMETMSLNIELFNHSFVSTPIITLLRNFTLYILTFTEKRSTSLAQGKAPRQLGFVAVGTKTIHVLWHSRGTRTQAARNHISTRFCGTGWAWDRSSISSTSAHSHHPIHPFSLFLPILISY